MKFDPDDVVLVTGATGFTGSHLLSKLSKTGVKIKALARASSDLSPFEGLPIEWHIGNIHEDGLVAKATHGVHYVFHVAAAFREAKARDEMYTQVHVTSTQLLYDNIAKQIKLGLNFKRFVHVSTAGVHGHIESPPADETYRFSAGDVYQKTKLEGELLIKKLANSSSMPLTVIRPCAIYGPGDRRLAKLFKMAKLPVCPILGFGCKGYYHLIHVDDLTQFMMESALDEVAIGQTFIVGNPTATSITEILKLASEAYENDTKFIRIPVTPVMAMAWICEKLCKAISIEPIIYPRRVAFFTKDRSFNTAKMGLIGRFNYKYTNKQGLLELAHWYKDNRWI